MDNAYLSGSLGDYKVCLGLQIYSKHSPGFLGQRFNNLQKAAFLTSSVQYGNYACGFNQSETGKYFK